MLWISLWRFTLRCLPFCIRVSEASLFPLTFIHKVSPHLAIYVCWLHFQKFSRYSTPRSWGALTVRWLGVFSRARSKFIVEVWLESNGRPGQAAGIVVFFDDAVNNTFLLKSKRMFFASSLIVKLILNRIYSFSLILLSLISCFIYSKSFSDLWVYLTGPIHHWG